MNMENHRCGMFDHLSLQYISDDSSCQIVSQNIYLQSQRCSVVWPLKEYLGCSACLTQKQKREKEQT